MKTKNFNNSRIPRQAKAELAISRMRKTSLQKGLSKLTLKEIEAEIIAVRKAKKRKVLENLKIMTPDEFLKFRRTRKK